MIQPASYFSTAGRSDTREESGCEVEEGVAEEGRGLVEGRMGVEVELGGVGDSRDVLHATVLLGQPRLDMLAHPQL
jgi:hypothetical protein